MNEIERARCIKSMHTASQIFYHFATRIGNHPFIEFTGLINEYIKLCEEAHAQGIDFSECSAHSGKELPMHHHNLAYINEKLDCIFGGRMRLDDETR